MAFQPQRSRVWEAGFCTPWAGKVRRERYTHRPLAGVYLAPVMCWTQGLQSETSQCPCPGRARSPEGTHVPSPRDECRGLCRRRARVREGLVQSPGGRSGCGASGPERWAGAQCVWPEFGGWGCRTSGREFAAQARGQEVSRERSMANWRDSAPFRATEGGALPREDGLDGSLGGGGTDAHASAITGALGAGCHGTAVPGGQTQLCLPQLHGGGRGRWGRHI